MAIARRMLLRCGGSRFALDLWCQCPDPPIPWLRDDRQARRYEAADRFRGLVRHLPARARLHVEPEPDLGVPKRPDRLIHRDGLSAVCEVKQFDKDPIGWMRETGQGGWFDENKPVRGAVRQAANQLRPLKGRGLPLVVVLANPNGYHVDLSGWVEVIPAVSEEAVPLPESFFNGPNDRRWRYDRETERIERVK